MKNINARLNTKDIDNAIKQIDDFKKELLAKIELFVSELADVGIEIAKQNIFVEENGEMIDRSNLVIFSKEVDATTTGATCIIIPTPTPYTTLWKKSKNGKDVFSAQVNPLLMAEFGSGTFATGEWKGSFPSPTARDNANRGVWAWYDTQGSKHYSYGNQPTRPLYKAKQEMENQIREIAERVFNA